MGKQTRSGSVLTFDSIAGAYPPERFILLLPQVSRNLLTVVPMWSLDVATVKVDPNNNKHAYEIGYNSGDFGLTKVSLDALATAADVSVMAKRVDDRRDRDYAEFEAHAIMTTPSGGTRGQGRTAEWQGWVEQEKCRQQAERWADKGIRDRWKGFSAANRELKVEQRYSEQWVRSQEFGKRMIESKACNRAIRALLGISPKYSFDELDQKEFAVVRFIFAPDLDDPQVKLLVVSEGLRAQRMLYAQPVPEQVTQPTALPPVEEPAKLMVPPDEVADVQEVEAAIEEEEEAPVDWPDAVMLIGNIMQKIELVENKSTQGKLRKRLQKAIGNTDGAQVNSIMDYLLSQENK
jgi:hypothetical protein